MIPTEEKFEKRSSVGRRVLDSVKALVVRVSALAGSRGSLSDARFIMVAALLLGLWLAAVIIVATRHEFWRDEVRALSFVRDAGSPLDLFVLLRDEGHPVLWYLLLYIGKSLMDIPLVLPATSIIVAFAAIAIFVLLSPFPLWWKSVFIFGCLPLYEYTVMARNYGISMLLLFVAAVLFRKRRKYPLALAVVVALLANTNVHSVILACAIALLWCWDAVITQKMRSLWECGRYLGLPLAIMIAGVLLSLAVTLPGKGTIVTDAYSLNVNKLAEAGIGAILHPERTFQAILPEKTYLALLPVTLPPLAGIFVVYLAVFGLLKRPGLFGAALIGQIAFGVLFRVVYSGGYRHQGLFLIFLVFLYWIALESTEHEVVKEKLPWLFKAGFYGATTFLVLASLNLTPKTMWQDIRMEMSSSKAFGQLLNDSQAYRDAIIVAEPDYLVESLPYYADNLIYIPREHRFGTTVSFTTDAVARFSLGELLSVARDIKAQYNRPTLVVLGHWQVGQDDFGEYGFSYNKVFAWNADELARFRQSTALVADFETAVGDENYRVYAIR
ncbi:MAG: hypothetical protein NT169_17465 [Chloroflexi bacterium]|nr:hypothetical protein [Chloroflexota bacterium]